LKTCDKNRFYVGQKLYGSLFYPEWQKHFRSPICPLCGYKNPEDQKPLDAGKDNARAADRSLLAKMKSIPKLVWPKYSKDYEMVALFSKRIQALNLHK
jgi:hypothetical protein